MLHGMGEALPLVRRIEATTDATRRRPATFDGRPSSIETLVCQIVGIFHEFAVFCPSPGEPPFISWEMGGMCENKEPEWCLSQC